MESEMIQVGWSVVLREHAPFQPPVSLFLLERESVARQYAATHNGIILPAYSPKGAPLCELLRSSPQL